MCDVIEFMGLSEIFGKVLFRCLVGFVNCDNRMITKFANFEELGCSALVIRITHNTYGHLYPNGQKKVTEKRN